MTEKIYNRDEVKEIVHEERTMKYKIDPNTGLPEVPEGMFWRFIERDKYYFVYPYAVELRGSVYGVPLKSNTWGTPHTKRNMKRRAKSVLKDHYAALERATKELESDKLCGDYPPKKLGE